MRVISHLYSDLTSGLCQHIPYLIRSRVFYRLTQQTSNSSKKMLDAYKKLEHKDVIITDQRPTQLQYE